jgi:hypothetical protein
VCGLNAGVGLFVRWALLVVAVGVAIGDDMLLNDARFFGINCDDHHRGHACLHINLCDEALRVGTSLRAVYEPWLNFDAVWL